MTVYLDTAFAVNGSVNYLLLLSAAYLAGAPLTNEVNYERGY